MYPLFFATVGLLVIALVALFMAAYADAQTRINCTTVPTDPVVHCSGAPTAGWQ